MEALDYAALQAQVLADITSFAGKAQFCLHRGWLEAAVEGYGILVKLMVALEHDEMVDLVNGLGVLDRRSSLIVKAWCQHHGVPSPVVEFETATCWGQSVGEVFDYRKGKKTWGALVSVRALLPGEREASIAGADPRMNGDARYRMTFSLKAGNPIRLRQATRNELKLWLGAPAVSDAMRQRRDEFVGSFSAADAARLERVTGLSLARIWSAIKNGDAALVERLGLIPNPKRDQMARRGMYVAEHQDPQGSLF